MTAEFPLDALPTELAELAKAASAAGNYPSEFVAVPGLSVLAAAIGHRAVLELQVGFVARPIIWAYVDAPPGAAKGPGQRYAQQPLDDSESLWARQHSEAMAAWNAEMADHKAAVATLPRGTEAPPEPPPPPPQRHSKVATATIEGLAEVLRDNPAGGILWAREELSAIIGALDQYHPGGKGDGRASFLELHDGRPISITRKGTEPIYVPAPLVSVCGGAVPTRLGAILGSDDGLPPRFLGVHRPEVGLSLVDLDRDVPPRVITRWAVLVKTLLTQPNEGSALPALEACQVVVVRLSHAAKLKWDEITSAFLADYRRGETTTFGQEVLGKASAHLAALALVLHCAQSPDTIQPQVSGETMSRAGQLIGFFVAEALGSDSMEPSAAADRATQQLDGGVTALISWLRRRGEVATARDVLHAHVAGCREAKEVRKLLGRYAATYPDCVLAARQPGVRMGPVGHLVVAPGRADLLPAVTAAIGATGASDINAQTPLSKIIPPIEDLDLKEGSEITAGGGSLAPVAPVAPVAASDQKVAL